MADPWRGVGAIARQAKSFSLDRACPLIHPNHMRSWFSLCLMLLSVAVEAAELVAGGSVDVALPVPRKVLKSDSTTDNSGQVVVMDSDPARKGDTLSEIAGFSRRNSVLRSAVELRDHTWSCLAQARASYPRARPIQIFLYPDKLAGGVNAEIVEAPDGVVFRLLVSANEDFEGEVFQRAVVKIVLQELGMRPGGSLGLHPERVRLPRWLIDGLLHAWRYPNALASLDELRPLLSNVELPSLESTLLLEEEVGAPSSTLELAVGRCLVSMLSNRADSSSGFFDLLHANPFLSPYLVLSQCFPSLGRTDAEIQKEWTVQVASLATQRSRMTMTGEESEEALRRLVEIDVINSVTLKRVCYPIESFDEYLRLPGIRSLLQARQVEFLAVGTKAHFLYSEVIALYATLCGELIKGHVAGLPARFRQARLERESIAARLSRIRDFMNWYEATPGSSEGTVDLRKFYQILDEGEKGRAKISAALDALEASARKAEEEADLARVLEESKGRKRK